MALWSLWTQCFPPRASFTEADVPSQAGRVFIVTGGNAGVGFELCKLLYGKGATVYMGARSRERAEAAIRDITSQAKAPSPPGQLIFLALDLDDLASVKEAAASFAARESRLDVLWNNAGVGSMANPRGSKTKQGTEAWMGLHCVAPLLFSKLLLPQLRTAVKASSPEEVRVVWTSSVMVENWSPAGGVDFDSLEEGLKDPVANYAASKAVNCFLAAEWARRHGTGNDPMISVTQNPGNLQTNMMRGVPRLAKFFVNFMLYPPKLGAYTELYAGLSPDVTMEKNGAFIMPWGRVHEWFSRKDILIAMKAKEEGGQDAAKRFWEWCEKKHGDFDVQ